MEVICDTAVIVCVRVIAVLGSCWGSVLMLSSFTYCNSLVHDFDVSFVVLLVGVYVSTVCCFAGLVIGGSFAL